LVLIPINTFFIIFPNIRTSRFVMFESRFWARNFISCNPDMVNLSSQLVSVILIVFGFVSCSKIYCNCFFFGYCFCFLNIIGTLLVITKTRLLYKLLKTFLSLDNYIKIISLFSLYICVSFPLYPLIRYLFY
jgi:hypothetical protein